MSGPFVKNDPRLEYDFDVNATLEIIINNRWCKVASGEFRSWTGPRRIDGVEYNGPVYTYLTNEVHS